MPKTASSYQCVCVLLQKLVGVVVLGEGGLEPGTPGCVALVAGGPAGAGSAAPGAGAPAGGAGPLLQAWRGADLYEHSLRRQLGEAYARPHLGPHSELPVSLKLTFTT